MSRAALALLLLAAATSTARADDWPQHAGGPRRAGGTNEAAAPGTTVAWSTDLAEPVAASPVLCDGVVVVAAEGGVVRGLREDTGAVLWTTDLAPGPLVATPACGSGRVVVAGGEGRLSCLAVETGALIWDLPATGGPRAAVAVAGDLVVASLGFPGRELVAIELRSGTTRWSFPLGQVGHSAPAVDAGLVVVGMNDGAYEGRDPGSGALRWRHETTGAVVLSAAALGGPHVLLLPGGEDARLHRLDPGGLGASEVTLVDPAPPGPAWAVLGTTLATATPVWTGSRVACVVRFDSVMDRVEPWSQADAWVSRERLYLVDPVAGVVTASVDLSAQDVTALAQVPPWGTCPTPVVLSGPSGSWLAVASSLQARLAFFDAATLAAGPTIDLPGARWGDGASPALGNGKLVLATGAGRVVALALGANSAPAAPALAAPGVAPTAITWTASADAEDAPAAIEYVARFDDDGEVLLDADVELALAAGQTSAPLPAGLTPGAPYTVRLRARDASGALSTWSTAVAVTAAPTAPGAPVALVATGSRDALAVDWQAGPGAFPSAYELSWRRLPAGAFGPAVSLGAVTHHDITGLETGASWEVRLVAVGATGLQSGAALAQATTQDPVAIGGQTYASLALALAAARPGDVVLVGAGTFHQLAPLVLPAGVVLRGASAHQTRLAGPGSGDVLRFAPGLESRLERIAVFGGDRGLVVQPGATARLENVLAYDLQHGLVVGPTARATAERVTIADVRDRGVLVEAGGALELASAIVTLADVGIDVRGSFTGRYLVVGANRVADRQGATPDASDALGLTPTFLDRQARDYREPAGAPTVDRGDPAAPFGDEPAPNGGRVNAGAFGNTALAAGSVVTPGATTTAAATGPAGSSGGGAGCALGAPAPGGPLPLALLALLALAARAASPRRRAHGSIAA